MSLNMAVVATIQLTPKVIGTIQQFIIQVRDPRTDRFPGHTEPSALVAGSLIRVGSRQKLRKQLSLAELGINPKLLGSIKTNIIARIKMNQNSWKKIASTIQDGSISRTDGNSFMILVTLTSQTCHQEQFSRLLRIGTIFFYITGSLWNPLKSH